MDSENRVIVLIDMDCFYCQVEEKFNPELKGKPIAVVQYNPWKGGGIIAVNYVARAMGVTRHMRGDEAKEKCPEIALPSVPCQRGKADITKYRDAGKEVATVLQRYTPLLERASIDEAYLDITSPVHERLKTLTVESITSAMIPNTFALGYDNFDEFATDVHFYGNDCIDFDHDNAKTLLVGALIVSEIRAAVFEETGYTCSAGISHNKILAKLVCGMNKPNKQTVLAKHSVNVLYRTLSVKKVKHLGGKFGDNVCDILKISKMGELQKFSEKQLQSKFDEKNGTWLYNIARGIDRDPVQAKFNPKSIGCCKQFKGKNALLDLISLKKWLKDLGDEIEDRLEKDALENNRTPKQMVVSFAVQTVDGRDTSSSRSYNFADEELCAELFYNKALELIMDSIEGVTPKEDEPNRKLQTPIKFLGISVGKFEDQSESKKTRKIMDYFSAGTSKDMTGEDKSNKENLRYITDVCKSADKNNKTIRDKDYIMKKFFQVTDKPKETKSEDEYATNVKAEGNIPAAPEVQNKRVLESSLDKQESFFAKFLNKAKNQTQIAKSSTEIPETVTVDRSTTPICQVTECGENSNDTDYSSSTINNEINKSICLFEETLQDVARVSNMRNLLNSTKLGEIPQEDSDIEVMAQAEDIVKRSSKTPSPNHEETFHCAECNKIVPLALFETHADYHFALKLRDEERQQIRKEREKTAQTRTESVKIAEAKKSVANVRKVDIKEPEANTSIASFLIKVDQSVPTKMCIDCGKKIPIEKYTEHTDFHEAQKLSRELNKKPDTDFTSSSGKRKRKTVSPVKKTKMLCKSIDSFFIK